MTLEHTSLQELLTRRKYRGVMGDEAFNALEKEIALRFTITGQSLSGYMTHEYVELLRKHHPYGRP